MFSAFFELFGVILTRCYGDFGCYSLGGEFYSVSRPFNVFPMSPDTINVTFQLNTRSSYITEEIYDHHNFSELFNSSFCSSCETKIIIHGFTERKLKPWLISMVKELLEHDDYNVIVVDWRNGAMPPYTQAVANARIMGPIVARFVQTLQNNFSVTPESIHLIGHSLGAQVASYVGREVKGLGRITGLDPAKPYFENTPIDVRLDSSDANFVDVIHTDTGPNSRSIEGKGYHEPIGHVDFYPNGGETQPGCNYGLATAMKSDDGLTTVERLKKYVMCNHRFSYMYFIESINSKCSFLAVPCRNWESYLNGECFNCVEKDNCYEMGFTANASKFHFHNKNNFRHQKFYLITGESKPHCRYHYSVTIEVTKGYFGLLHLTLSGEKTDSSRILFLNKKMHYTDETNYTFVFGEKEIENITEIILRWKAVTSVYYPSTWYFWKRPELHIFHVKVKNLESGKTGCFYRKTKLRENNEYSLQMSTNCTRPLEHK